jgi:methionine-rich copper-binding protein CopC
MRCMRILFAVIVVLLAIPSAFGHAQLDHANPKVGSKVDASPGRVQIWFDDKVDPKGTSIQVFDASSKQIDGKDCKQDEKDKTLMSVSLPQHLPDGTYKVTWTALCEDGHTTKGEFTFIVAAKQ